MLLIKIITLLNLDHQMHQHNYDYIIHFESSKFHKHKEAKMESNY